MQDYQARVVQELADLSAKITKLETFTTAKNFVSMVPDEIDRTLLIAQLIIMKAYESTLKQRVERFATKCDHLLNKVDMLKRDGICHRCMAAGETK